MSDVEAGVVAYLRALPEGGKPHTGDMRREIGCSNGDLKAAVERLRWAGKLHFERLELSPSMQVRIGGEPPATVVRRVGEDERPIETVTPVGLVAMPATDVSAAVEAAIADVVIETAKRIGFDAMAAVSIPDKVDSPLLNTTQQLLRDVDAWCARTGTPAYAIGRRLYQHDGFVGLVRSRGSVAAERITEIRALMADNPDGFIADVRKKYAPRRPKASESVTIAAEVAAEATERGASRRAARSTGSIRSAGAVRPVATPAPAAHAEAGAFDLSGLTIVEQIQTLLVDEPGDLIVAVGRVHRALWHRCLALGRETGRRPALILYLALDLGLAIVAEDRDELLNMETVDA